MKRYYTNLNKEQSSTDNLSSIQIKTTDVNVLLNRVRLDKKKDFKKKILFSLLMISLVSSISIFFII